MNRLSREYPAIGGYDWSVIDSPGRREGYAEFYSPDERDNPTPGRPTIEVFDPSLTGQEYDRTVLGDMLHHLPAVDPQWRMMRDEFRTTITPEQQAIDRDAYERDRQQGEIGSYDEWMDRSRLDAYLRGHLTPDRNDEWRDTYTPDQIAIMQSMKDYLRGVPRRAF